MKPNLKTAIRFTISSVWVVALSSALLTGYHFLISEPNTHQQADALEQRILLTLQQESEARLQKTSAFEVQLSDLMSEAARQSDELTALSQQQSEVEKQVESIALEAKDLEALKSRIKQVEQRQAQASRQTVRTSRAVIPKKEVEKKPTPLISVTPPPFVLFDVQSRGGVMLAIVGAPSAKQLSDLSAVRQGESYQQWRVVKVQAQRVTFRNAQGQDVHLEVNV